MKDLYEANVESHQIENGFPRSAKWAYRSPIFLEYGKLARMTAKKGDGGFDGSSSNMKTIT